MTATTKPIIIIINPGTITEVNSLVSQIITEHDSDHEANHHHNKSRNYYGGQLPCIANHHTNRCSSQRNCELAKQEHESRHIGAHRNV